MSSESIPGSHKTNGTQYAEGAGEVYSHGPDGAKLLDPKLLGLFREHTTEKSVADLGCGSADDAIKAAKFAKSVKGIDYQKQMTEAGRKKVEQHGLQDRVTLSTGDASNLDPKVFPSEATDVALSILVTCNLPKGTFQGYFSEMSRILKKEGRAVMVLPSAIDQIFTKASTTSKQAKQDLEKALEALPDNPTDSQIIETLKPFDSVLSATFVKRGKRLTLVTHVADLKNGEQIWRKLPNGLVIPNFYWSHVNNIKWAREHGLKVVDKVAPLLEGPDPMLGAKYEDAPIFTTYLFEKS